MYRPENPLIVQGDHTVLVEVGSPRYAEARDRLAVSRSWRRAPSTSTPTASRRSRSGTPAPPACRADEIVGDARASSPSTRCPATSAPTSATGRRYGRLRLGAATADGLRLRRTTDDLLAEQVARTARCAPLLGERVGPAPTSASTPAQRGRLKQALIAVGCPAEDLAGYTPRRAARHRAARPQPLRRRAVRPARLPAGGGRRVPRRRRGARRQRRDRAALRRGQDHRRHRRAWPSVRRHTLILTTSIDRGAPVDRARCWTRPTLQPRTRSASTAASARRSGR